ncbi:hypothetical protein M409DRAFT_67691 [Zasmidium cellare ATCC 36951]|uniref:Fungal-type protein kinase domain-containing protein n=1 Tax=Zasmidium cellare ATCC 36951 TaxID=1080233 RepID=A0A6A6CGH5_ZASCE|nr:uncharacterized protein M409DRAFT_67691 [Zasmidium cellare ATCC 36951]KAF2164526.1 hypothetical protein M409DRAFT_67691 [Zasmidium cellare ATCC 36951]
MAVQFRPFRCHELPPAVLVSARCCILGWRAATDAFIIADEDLRHGLAFPAAHKFRDIQRATNNDGLQSLPPRHSFSQFQGLTVTSSQSRKRKSSNASNHPWKRPQLNSSVFGAGTGQKSPAYAVQEPEGTSLVPIEPLPYANRIFRVLAITPTGRSISQFKSIPELLEGLRDAIKVHRSLYLDGKTLHRDISENNIIITDSPNGDGFKGRGQGAEARHRTGTMEFMAIEVLLRISHTYRHDLEAFFYVLIWLCARRGWHLDAPAKSRSKVSVLSQWYTGTYKDIARNKRGDIDRSGLEDILKDFPSAFETVKPLCRAIRDILFPYRDGLFTGTPQDPYVLYKPIIGAFDVAVATLQQAKASCQNPDRDSST